MTTSTEATNSAPQTSSPEAADSAPAGVSSRAAGAQLIPIELIDIPADRSRGLDEAWAEALAGMIAEAGLIKPITVRPNGDRFTLVTGLHRMSAFVVLERADIPALLSSASSDDAAKLEELVENLGHNDLNALDRAHHLYDLKQVYERLHPETKNGGDRKSEEIRSQKLSSDPDGPEIFGFTKDAAAKTGFSQSAIKLFVALWRGLSVTSRERCSGTWLASHQSSLIALSKLTPALQKKVLDILLADKPKATTVADALTVLDNGRLPTHIEKRFETINKSISSLKDAELDTVVSANAERLIAALKRGGHL